MEDAAESESMANAEAEAEAELGGGVGGGESSGMSVAPSVSPSVRALLQTAAPPLYFLQLRISEGNDHCLNQVDVDAFNAQVRQVA